MIKSKAISWAVSPVKGNWRYSNIFCYTEFDRCTYRNTYTWEELPATQLYSSSHCHILSLTRKPSWEGHKFVWQAVPLGGRRFDTMLLCILYKKVNWVMTVENAFNVSVGATVQALVWDRRMWPTIKTKITRSNSFHIVDLPSVEEFYQHQQFSWSYVC